jgi:hypothetical protein
MANQLYPKARQRFGKAQLNWETATIKAVLIYDTYTFDATDEFLVDIAGAHRGPVATLANKTITNGFANADPTDFLALALTAAANAVVFYVDTGSSATDVLIAYMDSLDGFPLAADSAGDFTLYPDVAFGGYFRL